MIWGCIFFVCVCVCVCVCVFQIESTVQLARTIIGDDNLRRNPLATLTSLERALVRQYAIASPMQLSGQQRAQQRLEQELAESMARFLLCTLSVPGHFQKQLEPLYLEWLDPAQTGAKQQLINWRRAGVTNPSRRLSALELELLHYSEHLPTVEVFHIAKRGNVVFHAADSDPNTATWRRNNPLRRDAPTSLLQVRGSLFTCTFDDASESDSAEMNDEAAMQRYYGQVMRFLRVPFGGRLYDIAQVRLWQPSSNNITPVPGTLGQCVRLRNSQNVFAPPGDVFVHISAMEGQAIAGGVDTSGNGSCVLAVL